jgi:hypothetical protein
MIKSLQLLLFILLSSPCVAQITFENGYYIDNSGVQ